MASELAHAAQCDPNFIIELAVGPPFPKLVPQKEGSGLVMGRQFVPAGKPKRFVMKKAHLSKDDYRVWDESGRLVAVQHHFGKNPYNSLDPLGLSNAVSAHDNKLGEWESVCQISGYCGMPPLKIRPKTMSTHGRQYIQDPSGQQTFANVGKESRLKSMSIRHNLAVRRGNGKDVIYRVLIDLYGRTMQIVNPEGQLVAVASKSMEALIKTVAFGSGSELLVDVAPGADWTAILAVVLGIKQVGAHFVKDAVSNFVTQPLTNAAVDGAVEAVGMQGTAAAAGHQLDNGVHVVQQLQQIWNTFYH
ncbi:hypothetical protein HXX76_006463 [Chlamydomonas incerta]|uniref:Uncharacterized protein n=1 Tax=Chlamydomonas incerta TaxID=51695 RepID=A0A835W604_CHLIN|nr:hypothetical protein HXX76_006463 [Chlamydomonas incerta]|eukprot:KAG2436946.1 hypothetical protein HXX76_006463 [Chlamydomonas incerta]